MPSKVATDGGPSDAEQSFALAASVVRSEPVDALGEPPVLAKSHAGARVDFDINRFAAFDASAVSVHPVLPVDSRFRSYGGRCLALRNVLTEEECDYLVRNMEGDAAPVAYHHDYRRNDRSIFDSPELAELLYRRIKPHMADLAVKVPPNLSRQHLLSEEPSEDCPDELRLGYGMEGVWHPIGLNECLRFCSYNAGGFFRKHCDAMFKRSGEEQSLFTCMFYLNGDLDGGATRFLNIDGYRDDGALELARAEEVMASVAPERGLCLLFFQKGLLHEGMDLRAGRKYILRSDVMFRRDPSTKVPRTPEQLQAMKLAEQASEAEERGALDLACQLYRRAFKMDPKLERLY